MRLALEARLTVPAGGWDFLYNSNAKEVAAGDYYPTTLAVAVDILCTTVSVSISTTTGRVTLTDSAGNFTINWTSTDLRDALGFTGDLSGASTYTSTRGAMGLWLPDCEVGGETFDPDTDGHEHGDESQIVGPAGQLAVIVGQSFYRSHRNVVFSHVSRAYALYDTSQAVISYQEWVRKCLRGGLSYFPITAAGARSPVLVGRVGGAVIGAADSDGIYRIRLSSDLELRRPVAGYTGYYTIEIPELIKV